MSYQNQQQNDAKFVSIGKEFDVEVNDSTKIRVRKTEVQKNDGTSHRGVQLFRVRNGTLEKGKSFWIADDAAIEVALTIIRKQTGPKTYKKFKAMLEKKKA
jgi:hypothetical protein